MNYRRNEDKLGTWPNRPLYNAVLDVSAIDDEEAEEPVTLEEIKAHLRIDFDDENAFLTALGKSCRKALEKYTGLSLVRKIITARLKNELGRIEFPYGPVVNVTAATYSYPNGDSIDGDTVEIIANPTAWVIVSPYEEIVVTYGAGYEPSGVPEDLKYALLEEIAFRYLNRGSMEGISQNARGFADAHKRQTWIL